MAVSPKAQFKQPVKGLRENDGGLILKLLPYVRRHPRLLLLSMGLLLPLSIAGAIQPLIIGQAVSLLRQESAWSFLERLSLEKGLQFLIILLLITIVIRLVCTSSQGFIVQKLGQNITAEIREDLFTHVTSLGTSFFNRTPVGRLITRLTSDVEALGDVFASGAIGVISDAIYILVILFTMFALQAQLALMLLLMMLPITGLIIYFQGQYRKANYKSREKLSELNSMLQENIAGINVVQLFRRERFNSELFRVINADYRQATNKTIFHDSAVSATLEWISLVAIAAVLGLGGFFITNDTITFGTLSAFILYAQRLFNPLRQFADKFTMFQAGFTAIERITELMKEPIEIKESDKNIQFLDSRKYQDKVGEICFDNVWFGYKPDEFVLKGLNFTISPG
ncbi:MAG: ABC transporter transmembrane domain-containing protein, partial [Crocosphaera sp.]